MSKLILFDIDGTLRDERIGIPYSVFQAIDGLRRKKHLPAICTGRSIGMIQDDVLQLGINTIVAGNGSYIVHKNKLIQDEGFGKEQINRLWNYVMNYGRQKRTGNKAGNEIEGRMEGGEYGLDKGSDIRRKIGCVLEGNYDVYMNWTGSEILKEMNREKCKGLSAEQERRFLENERITYQDNFKEYQSKGVKVHKICLWCHEDDFSEIWDMLGEEDIELAQRGAWGEYDYYEIIKKGMGKGSAVYKLCEYLEIDPKDTVAFGDGENDIDMFQACGIGIAMKQGVKRLLSCADSICEEPFEDGIYLELKRRNII